MSLDSKLVYSGIQRWPASCWRLTGIALLMVLFSGVLRADYNNQKLLHGPNKSLPANHSTLLLVPPVSAQIVRGGSLLIPIKVAPYTGGGIAVEVTEQPRFGHLESLGRSASAPALFRYQHDRSSRESQDSFAFRVRDYNGTWSAHKAAITIRNPPATIVIEPQGDLNFGKVPVGSTATRVLTMSNSFGTTAFGSLVLSPPWSIAGDASFILKEGDARSFDISFTPWRSGEESARLVIDPAITNVQPRYLNGEGIPPFRVISPQCGVITKETDKVSFMVTNITKMDVRVVWESESLPVGIQGSPPLILPPHGVGEMKISADHPDLAPESSRSIHPLLVSGAYTFPVEIVLKGPRANLSLELLRGAEVLATLPGVSLSLQGVIRNSSSVARTVEVHVHDDRDLAEIPHRQVTIPPSGFNTFDLQWASSLAGVHILSGQLSEDGKIVGEGEWKVSVTSPSSPPPSSDLAKKRNGDTVSPTDPAELTHPSGIVRLASETEVNNVVLDLSPSILPGLLRNSLMLRWRYPGSGNPGFVIEEKRGRNDLSDRSAETTENEWVKVDSTPVFDNGFWKAVQPMPWPGIHVYRVYPGGPGQKIIAPITMAINWWMVVWPPLRMLLGVIFLLTLTKVVRERL